MAYTTTATTKGGRNGRAVLDNGGLGLAMGLPTEMGGAGEGHNPEQLFALGWSSCFGQAILALAKKHGLDGSDARVTCAVTIDKDETSFALKAELKLRPQGGAESIDSRSGQGQGSGSGRGRSPHLPVFARDPRQRARHVDRGLSADPSRRM
jgi:lipoyl-dependent peroxiredoxin